MSHRSRLILSLARALSVFPGIGQIVWHAAAARTSWRGTFADFTGDLAMVALPDDEDLAVTLTAMGATRNEVTRDMIITCASLWRETCPSHPLELHFRQPSPRFPATWDARLRFDLCRGD